MAIGKEIKLAPSILSADITRLGECVQEAVDGGADYIHVDVMDGHYVPNLTFGPLVVKAIRAITEIPIDVHLMVQEPERFLPWFVDAGASILTVHAEAAADLPNIIRRIKVLGAGAGVAINPGTPTDLVEPLLSELDLVLLMTVNPGFSGQKFVPDVIPKIRRVRDLLDTQGNQAQLEVDGGINKVTIPAVVAAGATVLVAGSAVFDSELGVKGAIRDLLQSMGDPR
jgi:ribulose-phosphate 3-epimerase